MSYDIDVINNVAKELKSFLYNKKDAAIEEYEELNYDFMDVDVKITLSYDDEDDDEDDESLVLEVHTSLHPRVRYKIECYKVKKKPYGITVLAGLEFIPRRVFNAKLRKALDEIINKDRRLKIMQEKNINVDFPCVENLIMNGKRIPNWFVFFQIQIEENGNSHAGSMLCNKDRVIAFKSADFIAIVEDFYLKNDKRVLKKISAFLDCSIEFMKASVEKQRYNLVKESK